MPYKPLTYSFAFTPKSARGKPHAAREPTAIVVATASMSNETFASAICSQIGVDTITVRAAGYPGNNHVAPDCLFDTFMPILETINFADVLIFGDVNATQDSPLQDPFTRLKSNATTVTFTSVKFVPVEATSPKFVDWDVFLRRHPRVTVLDVSYSGLAGSLPSSIPPSMQTFSVPHNALTGTIPPGLLAGFRLTVPLFLVDLGSNRLTGSIPMDLTSNLNLPRATVIKLILANNSLTGTLLNFFKGADMGDTALLTVDFSRNKLSGSIPDAWTSSLSGTPQLTNLALNLGFNEFSSSVPSNLLASLPSASIQIIHLSLNNNLFSGRAPMRSIFTGLSTSSSLLGLELEYQHNSFTIIEDTILPVGSSTPLMEVNLNLMSNELTGSLPATLVSSLPDSLSNLVLYLSFNSFTGTIPNSWLKTTGNVPVIDVVLDNNLLEGSPFTLLDYTCANCQRVSISAGSNRFNATLPTILGSDLIIGSSDAPGLYINFSDNAISGSMTSSFLSHFQGFSLSDFQLRLGSNAIYGSIPPQFFENLDIVQLGLFLSKNKLTGALPPDLLQYDTGSTLRLFLDSNQLSGPLSAALQANRAASYSNVDLNFDNNLFGGVIPGGFLDSDPVTFFTASYRNCGLTGSVPGDMALPATYIWLYFDDNQLNGTLPLSELLTRYSYDELTFSATGNNFTGLLELPSMSISSLAAQINLSRNHLSDIVFQPTANPFIQSLDVSGNTNLSGSLPNSLFATTSKLKVLNAANTKLSGTIANLGSSAPLNLATLTLSSTGIDFCSGAKTEFKSETLTSCSLIQTTAVNCQSIYPSICFSGLAPGAPTCLESTRPGPSFFCINGVWTTGSAVETPIFVVPPGSTQTIVNADIESSEIIFNGLGATIVLSGCAANLSQVTVTLTLSDLESIKDGKTQLLISLTNTSCNDLSEVDVSLKIEGSSCKRVKATKAASNGQLSSIFSVDNSRCNRWWIILVAVVCGVIVIAVLIFILLVALVPSVRTKIRPYSNKRSAEATVN